MKIDTVPIQAEVAELCGSIKSKVTLVRKADRKTAVGLSVRFTDKLITVTLNPSKIRVQSTLDRHMERVREHTAYLTPILDTSSD